ncbi:MAG: hypothetical protein C4334_09260 [Pyrinomonas sp.]|uniref:hypothetical protein n=1 Tax=Pyrinomonas sp. TaxID=2080306 RepID=UPI00331CC450
MRARRQPRAATVEAIVAEIKNALGDEWLPRIYRERVRAQRTRACSLPAVARGNKRVEIQHTLLGVELKVGRRRVHCPDLATARYLATFARLGCKSVAVPYDITRISRLADDLESAFHRLLLLTEHMTEGRGTVFRRSVRARLLGDARREIEEIGAGPSAPQFNQTTRQRGG